MTISSMMNIALSGMRTEQNRLATVAGNIAHSGPGATTGAAGETDAEISLANELLTLKQAETGFKANALVFPLPLWERKKNHGLGARAPSRRFFR
jgi:hypothetical protein